jgi:antitoxin component HigA of HigAB toxin-antitoxin module
MNLKPIKTEADYQAALAKAYLLMDAELNTPAGEELDILTALIENYEAKYYPMTSPDPVAALKFQMEQLEMAENPLPKFDILADLVEFFETHDMGKYFDEMPEVPGEVNLKHSRGLVAIDLQLLKRLAQVAQQQHLSTTSLVNTWLSERVAQTI